MDDERSTRVDDAHERRHEGRDLVHVVEGHEVIDAVNGRSGTVRAGVLVLDTNQRVLAVNQPLIDMWDLPVEVQFGGRATTVFDHIGNRLAPPSQILDAVHLARRRTALRAAGRVLTTDGRTIEWRTSPVATHAGEHAGRTWIFEAVDEAEPGPPTPRRAART